MSSFDPDWLRLREPHDAAAREGAAGLDAPRWWASAREAAGVRLPSTSSGGRTTACLDVVDLGCGIGANLRVLAPRIGGVQRWHVVDHDPALLAAWPEVLADWARRTGACLSELDGLPQIEGPSPFAVAAGDPARPVGPGYDVRVRRLRIDLARDLARVPMPRGCLVTASALLDLVSAQWLVELVGRCRDAQASLLLALSVDGRIAWSPADPWDDEAAALFARHQRRDKGFGPALGAEAVPVATRLLRKAGYRVRTARTDWVLDPLDPGAADLRTRALMEALLGGMLQAVTEQASDEERALRNLAPEEGRAPQERQAREERGAGCHARVALAACGRIASTPSLPEQASAWSCRRHALMGRSRLRIGHLDLLATPPRLAG